MTAPFPVGQLLDGAWRLERVIGEGGMGTVYEATDLQLGRKVAVKVLHQLVREEDHARFAREARMMARIDHPNVVPLYAFGRQGEVPFIIMRLLEGVQLNVLLRENSGKLAWRQWRPLLGQLTDALEHIHEQQLVHRDLKPSNLFVSPTGWLTLLDMGLTRGWKSALTRTGIVWGTPQYISPEQAMAERTLDGRADLYSLAVLTYLILSGDLPFYHRASDGLMQLHLQAKRPDVSLVARGVPRAFGATLKRAMAVDPDERHASVREFLAEADRAFASQTAPARAPAPVKRHVPPRAERAREAPTEERTTNVRRRR